MTTFFSIADAKEAMKGSIVATVTNIGSLKLGTNSKGGWTMKIITLADGSGNVELAAFNDDITKFKLNCKYEIENPWWKNNNEGKLAFSLGGYAKVKLVSVAETQETIHDDDDQVPTSDEFLKEKQAEIKVKFDSLPPIEDSDLVELADKVSITMYQIKRFIGKNIATYEENPNGGMVWEMAQETYRQWKEKK